MHDSSILYFYHLLIVWLQQVWLAILHQDEISKGWDSEGGRCRRGKVPVSWPVSQDFLGAAFKMTPSLY